MASGNQPIIVEERRNGMSIAIVAIASLLIVGMLAVLAVLGAGYLMSTGNDGVNNPPATTTQPTSAPPPTDDGLLPIPNPLNFSTSFGAG